MTPIEKIRSEIAAADLCCDCHGERRLAADKLKLAEWIEQERLASDDVRFEFAAQSVLDEVAR